MIAKNKRPAKFSTQAYTRCERCGRPHSVYRKFKLCRVCLRELAQRSNSRRYQSFLVKNMVHLS